METTLYIVRHGETDNNYTHRFIGSTDHPLNERGMAQAACLRAPFAKLHLDAIYSSPRRRAYMTAEQILGDRDMPIICDDGLAEIHCGQWEGLNRAEIEARWPGMIDLWQFRPDELHMPDGETFEQVQQRAVEAIVNIVRHERGKCVAVACHMLTIQLIMAKLLNIPIREVWNMVRIENTSISTVKVYDNGDFDIVRWGDDSHLPPELKTGYVRIAGFVQKNYNADYDVIKVEGKHNFPLFAK
ncbi:MAG: histidine phosphatase family protein [Eubacteriales bacterium]|nr:histidine phosphatase family protein [Eubacteriales bacterium]